MTTTTPEAAVTLDELFTELRSAVEEYDQLIDQMDGYKKSLNLFKDMEYDNAVLRELNGKLTTEVERLTGEVARLEREKP